MNVKKIINSTKKSLALFIIMVIMSISVYATTTQKYFLLQLNDNRIITVYYSINNNTLKVEKATISSGNSTNYSQNTTSNVNTTSNINTTSNVNTTSNTNTTNATFNDLIFYCNTSLKTSLAINDTVKQKVSCLTYGLTTDYDKALALYNFVSTYITYDYNRANTITTQGYTCNMKAGAQYAFDTKTGVCYEFATLYAAMALNTGLRVRCEYNSNHIWNEVYNNSTSKWMFVDCTWKLFNVDITKYHQENYKIVEV